MKRLVLSIAGPNSTQALNKALDLADFYVQARDPDQAVKFIERVTNALGPLSAERKQDLAPRLISTIGNIVMFRQYASQATAALHAVLPLLNGSVMTSDVQSKLSRTAQAFGNAQLMDEAEEINKLLVRYAEKAPSREGLELARRRFQLARLYERQGNAGKAIELLELALAAEEKVPEAVRARTEDR